MKDSRNSQEKVVVIPVPPDGGYGWVIVFASFTLSMILDGVCFTVGLYFSEFLDYFEESKAETAWVGSVLNGMYMFIGPVVSCLCNYFGCRPVAFAGGILTCISFVLATFSPNLSFLTITFGAMAGMGFGLFYLPAIVMVGFYFEKRRALATGIAVCGSGIGGAVFAPLTRYLIDIYSWKGAILIIAGISLNSLVMTALLKPLVATVNVGEDLEQLVTPDAPKPRPKFARRQRQASDGTEPVYFCSLADFSDRPLRPRPEASVTLSCDHIWSGETSTERQRTGVDVSRPEFRKDAFFVSGSLARIPEFHDGQALRPRKEEPYVCSVTNLVPLEEEAERRRKGTSLLGRAADEFRRFKESLDLTILKSPTCLTYGASCTLCMIGFFVPFMYVPRLAVEHGFTAQEAATIITVMSFTNVVGRVVIGLVSDLPFIDCIHINNFSLILGGVAIACIPHFPSMVPMIISSVLFGLAIAAFVSLRSIIMVELMGLEKLSTAFGFVTLCQGMSSFFGTPIAGALSDTSGDFHSAFYMAGGALCLSGLMCFPLRRISRWEKSDPNRYLDEPQSDDDDMKLVDIPRSD